MTNATNAAGDGVHELVRQRDQLRAWIARLDEVQAGAPSRVTQRVRADYEDRLRRVTEDLSAHGEEIRRGLDEGRAQLEAAETRRAHAADALEETRLRHLIGELDEGAWNEARQPLEAEAAAADKAVAQAAAEVERLSTLSTEIAGDEAARAEAEEALAAPQADAFESPEAAEPEAPAPAAEAPAAERVSPVEHEWGAAPRAAQPGDRGGEPVSGEDLAAWITEVEAEASEPASPPPPQKKAEPAPPPTPAQQEDAADGWDPFANEFGSGPASPATQPGDAARDLPWLDSLEGGAAGKWAAPAEQGGDELAFLEHLDAPPPAAGAPPAADLAEDDLAFLEELDRAISGGTQRPPEPSAPEPADPSAISFAGGSGDGGGEGLDATEDAPKRGEALLCKECGAINEPQAWYCEICGSEL